MPRLHFALGLMASLVATSVVMADEARLLRFPTTHGDKVVFTYAGDLYSVSTSGGAARRLTGHEGFEMFARFSPDGKQLAFTGQYDGNTEVYLMPAEGGEPKRLTYTATLGRDDVADRMGPNNVVMTWTPDGKRVVFRTRAATFNPFKGELWTVTPAGEFPEPLPLPRGGFCSFSPDGKKLAYNRVFREFRTWKRYRGGMADDIWLYDFATKKTDRLTGDASQDLFPMWVGDKIYFVSERSPTDPNRSARASLFVHDLKTKADRRLTNFTDFDIKFPSLGDKAIVFEKGGYLFLFDLATEEIRKVDVAINEDLSVGRGGLVAVGDKIANAAIGPDGKRALFSARGDLFTVPVENGPTRNLTKTPGVHERDPKWSPDGKWIAAISDASGENELTLYSPTGASPPKTLTKGADTYYYNLEWSPDSKYLLWSDKKLRLRYTPIDNPAVMEVASATAGEITDFAWSPDSQWIAYSRPEQESMATIYLYSLRDQKTIPVTDGWHASGAPAFSQDGKYLFFVSNRDFTPIYSATEWNHAYRNMERIYFVTLAKTTPSPFAPESDEVAVTADKTEDKKAEDKKADSAAKDGGKNGKGDGKEKAKDAKEKTKVTVDADGIKDRIASLPIKAANYGKLTSVGDRIFYLRREGLGDSALAAFDLKKKKETSLGAVRDYDVSADGKKALIRQKDFGIVDLPTAPVEIKQKLNLDGMEVQLDRSKEWAQIFDESWRQMKHFFYDPSLHGVDWQKARDAYEPMVKHVRHRADLTYLLGEMIGELNVGHTYVGGGEAPAPKRIPLGLLGARLSRDAASGHYRIDRILRGRNWDAAHRAPLTEIGVDAKEGDYILAVDGASTRDMANIYASLVNKAGKPVTLRLAPGPKDEKARDVVVIPTADEHPLYYDTWVEDNIAKVAKATDGKVGYLHIPDMQVEGLNQFARLFYPQLRRKALIIDVRGNGGGNVSPMIIERLRREPAMFSMARNVAPYANPTGLHLGPKVLLMDEFSASDGDLVAYRFRKYKLGPLVGKRSWGGVVGIRGTLPLLDGGYLNKPEFAPFDLEAKNWIIEGVGVVPDIIVDNDPAQEYAGVDQQLTKAIELALDRLKTDPPAIPDPPPFPEKR